MIIRTETRADQVKVYDVHRQAFGGREEESVEAGGANPREAGHPEPLGQRLSGCSAGVSGLDSG
ncbi:hypothetical protein J6TS7_64480 [Paenibacillus dendritiformis]|nr:hypothetical protein J6TS7_64480 [Paenibacillus dendritiformis]